MKHKRILATAIAAATLSLAATTAAADGRSLGTQADVNYRAAEATCQEDMRCWNCRTMGDLACGRAYPVHIEGRFLDGWRIRWSDGHSTVEPPWSKLRAECAHDDNPDACLTAWMIRYHTYGEERAMIRGLR